MHVLDVRPLRIVVERPLADPLDLLPLADHQPGGHQVADRDALARSVAALAGRRQRHLAGLDRARHVLGDPQDGGVLEGDMPPRPLWRSPIAIAPSCRVRASS